MDNNELLQQILSAVVDMRQDITQINSRLDKVDSRLDKVDSRLDKLETRQAKLESDITAVKTILETETNCNIKLLAEGYEPLAVKTDKLVDDVDEVKFDVGVIKAVVTTHSNQINKLKKVKQ